METKIHYVTRDEMDKIQAELQQQDPALYFAEIEGAAIQNYGAFMIQVGKAFKFHSLTTNVNGYLDWMRDFTWLPDASGFVLVINQFSLMMIRNLLDKVDAISLFPETIFPWWEGEVEKFMVGGKKKPFAVYLVEQPLESVGPLFEGLADAAEAREEK